MIRVLLVHCLILSLSIAAAAANTDDRDALLALKAHVNNDPSNFLSKYWNTSSSVCNWMGITCDVYSRRVTALNLSHLSLTGTIPSQLGNLSSLQTLILSANHFSGIIPSSIFSINTLKVLDLSDNQLSGSFPSFISNMSSLQVVDFRYNRIFGEFPPYICNYLPFLQILRLRSNMFYGKIPKEIGNLTKLKEIYLEENKLQGEIPHEIGNLLNVEYLGLYQNELVGAVPVTIFNMSSLNVLALADNSFSGILSSSAHTRLPNLEAFVLWEYGREGQVSTKGDVYSFGIVLMETFTGKKPTHEVFVGDITLSRWVNDLLPISFMEVVDVNLLSREDEHYVAKEQCVSSILNLAMECTVEFPEKRINAKEIARALSKIRDSLLRNIGGRRMRSSQLV